MRSYREDKHTTEKFGKIDSIEFVQILNQQSFPEQTLDPDRIVWKQAYNSMLYIGNI